MEVSVCYSGGALGADLAFGDAAKQAGHKIVHWHFQEKKRGLEDHAILNKVQLKFADPFLIKANQTLRRGEFPYEKEYTNDLLRRNFYQVVQSDTLYAVSRRDTIEWHSDRGRMFMGGTAWAIQMFIDKYKGQACECYVFDMVEECWWKWDEVLSLCWHKCRNAGGIASDPPLPNGKYAGVGSRELTTGGLEAIRNLYGNC
jgi:hypothetical protein